MQKRIFLRATALAALQDNVFKIGLILPMTGPFAPPAARSKRQRACTWPRTATPWPARRWS
jgi:hypothetical protein